MTISPCAMLMTPIVPKVMASPMAARSSTEPSEMPYQTFWAICQAASVCSTESAPAVAAVLTSPSEAAATVLRMPSESRSARSRTTAMAASF